MIFLSPVCLLLLLVSSDTCFTRSNVFGWLEGWYRNEHWRSNPGFAAYLGTVSVANHLDSSAFAPSLCALPNPSTLTASPTCSPTSSSLPSFLPPCTVSLLKHGSAWGLAFKRHILLSEIGKELN